MHELQDSCDNAFSEMALFTFWRCLIQLNVCGMLYNKPDPMCVYARVRVNKLPPESFCVLDWVLVEYVISVHTFYFHMLLNPS